MTNNQHHASQKTASKLLNIRNLKDIAGIPTTIAIFEDAMTQYIKTREGNAYKQMINTFFVYTYEVGKMPLGVSQDYPLSITLFDIILKSEKSASIKISAEDAKYLKAFLHEFIRVTQNMVQHKDESIDNQEVTQKMLELKDLLPSVPSSSAVRVMVDNLLSLIDEQVSGSEGVDAPKAVPELPLHLSSLNNKLSISEAMKNLYSYNEEDFCRLVSHAYKKFGFSLFLEEKYTPLPVYLVALTDNLQKGEVNMNEFLTFFKNKTKDHVTRLNFFPLQIEGIEDIYRLLLDHLHEMKTSDKLNTEEEYFFKLTFLENTMHLSQKLANLYIEEAEQIAKAMTKDLDTLSSKSFHKTITTPSEYTLLHELLFENGNTRFGVARYVEWRVVNGEHMIIKGNDPKEKREKIGVPLRSLKPFERTEFDAIRGIYNKLLVPLKKASEYTGYEDDKYPTLKEFLQFFEHHLISLELNSPVFYELCHGSSFHRLESDALGKLFYTRMHADVLKAEEIDLLVEQKENWHAMPFNFLPVEQRDNLLGYLSSQEFLCLTTEKDFKYLFNAYASPSLMYKIATSYYQDKDEIQYISDTVMNATDYSPHGKVQKRNQLLYAYLLDKVENASRQQNTGA